MTQPGKQYVLRPIAARSVKWRQFRLSTLLIATAVLCAWLACHVNHVHREQVAIASLEQAGVYVTTASSAPQWMPDCLDKTLFQYVIDVNCRGSNGWGRNEFGTTGDPTMPLSRVELFFLMEPANQGDRREGNGRLVTDELMRNLAAFKYCKMVYLANAKISDEGVRHLAGLEHLQVAWLNGTGISDDGLKNLSNMKHLCHLGVDGTKVTDRGATTLQRVLPDCHIAR